MQNIIVLGVGVLLTAAGALGLLNDKSSKKSTIKPPAKGSAKPSAAPASPPKVEKPAKQEKETPAPVIGDEAIGFSPVPDDEIVE